MTRRTRALLCLIKIQDTEKSRAKKELFMTRETEETARNVVTHAENTMVQEREIAQLGRSELDDFRTWFPIGLNGIEQAREAHDRTLQAVEQARIAALHATMVHKATQDIFQRREKERNDFLLRRESNELDELARRRLINETFTSSNY